jgi:hypothetical protein
MMRTLEADKIEDTVTDWGNLEDIEIDPTVLKETIALPARGEGADTDSETLMR